MDESTDDAAAGSRIDVLIVVPPGTRRPDALAKAVAEHHPTWRCRAVWAGDPQLRPRRTGGLTWVDAGVTEHELLRCEGDGLPWLAAAAVLEQVDRPTIVLVAGVAVLGDLSALVPTDDTMVVVPRVLDPALAVGKHPTLDVLAENGSVSESVAAFGAGSGATAAWIRRELLVPSRLEDAVPAGRVLELAAQLFSSSRCVDDRIGASVWRWPDRSPHLLDLPAFDNERPWLADPDLDGRPHVTLGVPERVAAVERALPQLAGRTAPLCLPGGIEIDETIRRVARRHDTLPFEPWSEARSFRRWLDTEYWRDLHTARGDLQVVFPYPDGLDADRFAAWKRRAAADGVAPLMIEPGQAHPSPAVSGGGMRLDGVNLVGYFKHQSGVSNVGRRVAGILERNGVPFSTIAYERTWSPRIDPEPSVDQRVDFAHSLAFVNGDQFDHLANDIPEVFGDGRQVVGMWSWELETIEGGAPVGHRHASQIWGTTTFMADPFRHLPVRVEHVHVPFTEPSPSDRRRHEFGPLAEADGRFVFGVVLDHLSITARKNPVAAIRAFRRAFPDGSVTPDGPLLVVKTINGARCWIDHERLLVEAAGRDDIVIWDELLPIADHVALIGSFDALVSLHRSEGVGLHLAEAMWLERPIIATNYSGNLDFMDADSAMLIDADMVAVGPDLRPYPADALWAEARLDDAADAMRRLVADRGLCERLGSNARARMLAMPGEQDFIERMRTLLGLEL